MDKRPGDELADTATSICRKSPQTGRKRHPVVSTNKTAYAGFATAALWCQNRTTLDKAGKDKVEENFPWHLYRKDMTTVMLIWKDRAHRAAGQKTGLVSGGIPGRVAFNPRPSISAMKTQQVIRASHASRIQTLQR